MFAAKLRDYFKEHGNDAVVESAGIAESAKGQPAANDWSILRDETRVDLSEHRSRWIGDLDLSSFDAIYCMDADTLAAVKQMVHDDHIEVELANQPNGIPNPWTLGTEAYRECYRTVCEAVEQIPPNR